VELNNQRRTASRKTVYGVYLGNVIKMVNVNARWVCESFGAEGELKMLDDVIKYCEEEKERVKQIWKLGGMTQ
jgi:hypothetical protein